METSFLNASRNLESNARNTLKFSLIKKYEFQVQLRSSHTLPSRKICISPAQRNYLSSKTNRLSINFEVFSRLERLEKRQVSQSAGNWEIFHPHSLRSWKKVNSEGNSSETFANSARFSEAREILHEVQIAALSLGIVATLLSSLPAHALDQIAAQHSQEVLSARVQKEFLPYAPISNNTRSMHNASDSLTSENLPPIVFESVETAAPNFSRHVSRRHRFSDSDDISSLHQKTAFESRPGFQGTYKTVGIIDNAHQNPGVDSDIVSSHSPDLMASTLHIGYQATEENAPPSTLEEESRNQKLHSICELASSASANADSEAAESQQNTLPQLPIPIDRECLPSTEFIVSAGDNPREGMAVTDEQLVLEAWEVVKESFLDARHDSWTPEAWEEKKVELMKRPPHSRMAAHSAISTMLISLQDPYSRFLSPAQFAELAKYDVTGVGLNLAETFDGEGGTPRLRVLGLVIGSPAQQAGIRQGDEVLAVNGTPITGKSAFEVSSLIQGPKGTPVTLQVRHANCEPELLTVSRTSDTSVSSPVAYRLERPRGTGTGPLGEEETAPWVGYIRLREFNALAKRDLLIAMERLQKAGATAFTLDLQDNPGGLVQAGVEIARLFLDPGSTVVYTQGRDEAATKSTVATRDAFTHAPLMVLVNDRTASASEILAGALHDNCRAILVGHRTFGKGLIQAVYELSDGSGMVLTIGKYVTPAHIDIDGNGIEPDFRRPPGFIAAERKLASCQPP